MRASRLAIPHHPDIPAKINPHPINSGIIINNPDINCVSTIPSTIIMPAVICTCLFKGSLLFTAIPSTIA